MVQAASHLAALCDLDIPQALEHPAFRHSAAGVLAHHRFGALAEGRPLSAHQKPCAPAALARYVVDPRDGGCVIRMTR